MSPAAKAGPSDRFAVVAIGRNEGERLERCLDSIRDSVRTIVYVDSGSSDRSVENARRRGAEVVELDMTRPFTAARARNEGFARAVALAPHLEFVQFVDGDCEVHPQWFDTALAFLDAQPKVAAVCGWRRERYPERSVYNRLCDAEWNPPDGDTPAFGGDVMLRVRAFDEVGGYLPGLIAGEEPELSVRLRARGWRLWRLGVQMTLHDAAMTRFSQWWKRTLRTGFAFAAGADLHGAPPERHWVRESRSAWIWGAGLPLATLVGSLTLTSWIVCTLLLYPLQWLRLTLRSRHAPGFRAQHAFFLVLGKFPEALGQIKYVWTQWRGRHSEVIEYK